MTVDLRETRLPGVGVKYAFGTAQGGRLSVILHNDGQREIYYYRRASDDEPTAVIELHDDEARQLGAILGGAYERPRIVEELELALGELQIEWVPVPDTSPAIGHTLAAGAAPRANGSDRDRDPARAGARQRGAARRRHSAGRHAGRRRQGRAVREVSASPRRGAVRVRSPKCAAPGPTRRSRSAPRRRRRDSTRSAFSTSRPGSSAATWSGVTWIVGIARAADAVGHVREVVADEEQRAAGCERGRRALEHQPALGRRQVEVEQEDEVERARLRLVLEQVGDREVDGDALALGARSRLGDRDLREVDAGDVPAESCEPDRVLAFAAGEVERTTGRELVRPRRRGTGSASRSTGSRRRRIAGPSPHASRVRT